MKKIIIQILLFVIILLICLFSYIQYFHGKNSINEKITEESGINNDNTNNLIKNLKYDVKFDNNTQYTITSDLSEVTYVNAQEIVIMQNVRAIFKDEKGSVLKITSINAIFNNETYNTSFEKNVQVEYLNNFIYSEKLMLNFEENIVTISDNIVYEGIQGFVKADNIKIDLISKDVEVFMNNEKDKVEITSKE